MTVKSVNKDIYKSLIACLKKQKKASSSFKEEISRWVAQYEIVFTSITTWLKPLLQEDLITIDRSLDQCKDGRGGDYWCNKLNIRSYETYFEVKPVGYKVIGAEGRIDFCHGGRQPISIALRKGIWYFLTVGSSFKKPYEGKKFNKKNFLELVVAEFFTGDEEVED